VLRWKVLGPGSYAGRAQVRIVRPDAWLSAPVGFTYRCG
jgi:hypothetical protein